jgi:outer membrane protein insertion porin family
LNRCIDANGNSTPAPSNNVCEGGVLIPGAAPFVEKFLGDTAKPRLSVGFGVNWNSPFGPFRIDIAKALLKADGDDTKLITFNVGTAF